MTKTEYISEMILNSLDKNGFALPYSALEQLAKDIEIGLDLWREMSGEDCIPHPLQAELASERLRLEKRIKEAEGDTRIMRDSFAARVGIEPHRLHVHNGRVEVSRT